MAKPTIWSTPASVYSLNPAAPLYSSLFEVLSKPSNDTIWPSIFSVLLHPSVCDAELQKWELAVRESQLEKLSFRPQMTLFFQQAATLSILQCNSPSNVSRPGSFLYFSSPTVGPVKICWTGETLGAVWSGARTPCLARFELGRGNRVLSSSADAHMYAASQASGPRELSPAVPVLSV